MVEESNVNQGATKRVIVVLLLLFMSGAAVWFWGQGDNAGPLAEAPDAAPVAADVVTDTAAAPRATDPETAADAPIVAEIEAVTGSEPNSAPADDAAELAETAPTPLADETSDTAEDVAVETGSDAAPEVDTREPSFDLVRVEADGSTVIAGRAAPGSEVALILDGAEAAKASVDASGNFVALLGLGTSDVPRSLSLTTRIGDGGSLPGGQVVILAPSPEKLAAVDTGVPAPATDAERAKAQPDVPSENATQEATAQTSAAPATVSGEETGTATAGAPEVKPEQPAVILADETGVRILQGGDISPEVTDNVVIDAITYDADGEVQLSGRAPANGFVRVYVNNRPVEIGDVGSDGQWKTGLPDIDTGVYTLRVDQVDGAGAVVSRAETPFRREAPEDIRALTLVGAETEDRPVLELITVQPGNTLWGISNEAYGDGVMFVRLFEANRDKIRNPDLIYPGQVFSVPD